MQTEAMDASKSEDDPKAPPPPQAANGYGSSPPMAGRTGRPVEEGINEGFLTAGADGLSADEDRVRHQVDEIASRVDEVRCIFLYRIFHCLSSISFLLDCVFR